MRLREEEAALPSHLEEQVACRTGTAEPRGRPGQGAARFPVRGAAPRLGAKAERRPAAVGAPWGEEAPAAYPSGVAVLEPGAVL
ncbi:MAG: hypothetical protein AAGA56_24210, partial [Myxococcota bacterium]